MHIACGFGRLKSVQTLMKLCPKLIEQNDDKGHNPIDVAIKVLIFFGKETFILKEILRYHLIFGLKVYRFLKYFFN